MKIENLKQGIVLKSYKELCSKLEITSTKSGSNSRKAQVREIERFCKFRKIEGTNKIEILEIYKEVKPKMVSSAGNNVKYIDDMEYLILTLLSDVEISKNERVGFSKNYLYEYCGLSNVNFKRARGNVLKFSEMVDMPVQTITECFEYTSNRMLVAVQRTLNRLQRQSLITWGNGYNLVLVDEQDVKYLEVASVEEERLILKIERDALTEMGYKDKRQVFVSGRWDEFKKKTTEELKQMYSNLCYYYDSICFNYNKSNILKALEGKKVEDNTINNSKAKTAINSKFAKSLDSTIDYRHKKAKESKASKNVKAAKDKRAEIFDNYRGSDNYRVEQKQIKNTIVKENAKEMDIFGVPDISKVKDMQRSFFDDYAKQDTEQITFNTAHIVEKNVPF